MASSFVRKFYKAHIYAGFFVAFHFAVLALTGLGLLFKDEIQGTPPTPLTATPLDGARYEIAWRKAHLEFPRDRPLAIFPDAKNPDIGQLRFGIDGETKFRGARKISFDVASGKALTSTDEPEGGVFGWLLRLHREIFLGTYGKLYVGVVGLVYVFMLLSGVVLYGRFMRGRRFGAVRTANPVQRARDLHKFLGGITFAWGLVVGLSGAFLAFNGVLLKLHQSQALSDLRTRYLESKTPGAESLASLGSVVDAVRKARPEATITYIAFPETEFSIPGHFLLLANGTTPLTKNLSEMAIVEAASGRLVEVLELPWYLKLTMLSEPLHFGNYGGLPLKLGWAIFTLLSLTVVGMGVFAFWRKRRAVSATTNANVTEASTNPLFPEKTYPYAKPALLAFVTVVGIWTALVSEGAFGTVSGMLAWIPVTAAAVTYLFYRRRDV